MILYDSLGPNPATIRIFIAETGHHFGIQVEAIDIRSMENRRENYTNNVNTRGEIPALRLDNGDVITEITAICEYLDEISGRKGNLIGHTPEERATTRMWTRRMFLEICHPLTECFRNNKDFNRFYQGHRKLFEDMEAPLKELSMDGIDRLNIDLTGKTWITGDRLTLADILLFAFIAGLSKAMPWILETENTNLNAWFARMKARQSTALAETAHIQGQVV